MTANSPICGFVLSALLAAPAWAGGRLPDTEPLAWEGDIAARMVAGIGSYLDRELERAVADRDRFWDIDDSSVEAYLRSVEPNRQRLRHILGVTDERVAPRLEYVGGPTEPALLAEGDGFKVYAVRWAVLPGVDAEGLLFEPDAVKATLVLIPDADQTPEMLAGLVPGSPALVQDDDADWRILIPTLINRNAAHSGNAALDRWTNQSHREFVYRMAYQMGRHVLGYEVQKVLAAVDWARAVTPGEAGERIAVAGYGEGGLVARLSAAVDPRIKYVAPLAQAGPADALWPLPIDRNLWAFSREFGNPGLARLIAPRPKMIETRTVVRDGREVWDPTLPFPRVGGPPPEGTGRRGAAPGRLRVPTVAESRAEERRERDAVPPKLRQPDAVGGVLQDALAVHGDRPVQYTAVHRREFDATGRQRRQFEQLVGFTQRLWRASDRTRERFWAEADPSSVETWEATTRRYRDYFWEEVIGKLPPPDRPMNPRSRLIYNADGFTGYEVSLDLYEGVFAYGILLLPKDLKPGERRPVVVCQHGLEGRPTRVCDPDVKTRAYHSYGAELARQGFIVYAPQNPYVGGDDFRVLQRKANPLKLSLFSFIIRQHERTLEWLKTLPQVDGERIALYGLSYGGKTAMRVPAVLEGYSLSVCSGDFNEWIGKNVSTDLRTSYMFTGEYEMPEFDLGNTFNYAEMAYLIAPRPFMVERGHDDAVGTDEMVAWEFAKVRRLYSRLGIPERAEIEFFPGGHEVRLIGTMEFLRRHLNWPAN